VGDSWHFREAIRLRRLAEQATTERVRQTLLQQAAEREKAAMEFEILAQHEEVERLLG
jgi:hypothetical protein